MKFLKVNPGLAVNVKKIVKLYVLEQTDPSRVSLRVLLASGEVIILQSYSDPLLAKTDLMDLLERLEK